MEFPVCQEDAAAGCGGVVLVPGWAACGWILLQQLMAVAVSQPWS